MDILEDDKTMIEEIKELDEFFINDALRFTDKMSNTKYFRGMKTPYYMDIAFHLNINPKALIIYSNKEYEESDYEESD